jgi:uncharacterized protein YjbJ (UPF0337 family)
MTWETMAGNWQDSQTKVRRRWSRLTDEDLRRVNGRRAELVMVVAERYGLKRDQAETQIEDFEQSDEFEAKGETSGSQQSRGAAGEPGQFDENLDEASIGDEGGGPGQQSGRMAGDTSRETTGKSGDTEDEPLNQPRRGAQETGRTGGMRSEP